jgi:hypothetical protein
MEIDPYDDVLEDALAKINKADGTDEDSESEDKAGSAIEYIIAHGCGPRLTRVDLKSIKVKFYCRPGETVLTHLAAPLVCARSEPAYSFEDCPDMQLTPFDKAEKTGFYRALGKETREDITFLDVRCTLQEVINDSAPDSELRIFCCMNIGDWNQQELLYSTDEKALKRQNSICDNESREIDELHKKLLEKAGTTVQDAFDYLDGLESQQAGRLLCVSEKSKAIYFYKALANEFKGGGITSGVEGVRTAIQNLWADYDIEIWLHLAVVMGSVNEVAKEEIETMFAALESPLLTLNESTWRKYRKAGWFTQFVAHASSEKLEGHINSLRQRSRDDGPSRKKRRIVSDVASSVPPMPPSGRGDRNNNSIIPPKTSEEQGSYSAIAPPGADTAAAIYGTDYSDHFSFEQGNAFGGQNIWETFQDYQNVDPAVLDTMQPIFQTVLDLLQEQAGQAQTVIYQGNDAVPVTIAWTEVQEGLWEEEQWAWHQVVVPVIPVDQPEARYIHICDLRLEPESDQWCLYEATAL